jgi:hypothetical protein
MRPDTCKSRPFYKTEGVIIKLNYQGGPRKYEEIYLACWIYLQTKFMV